VDDELFFFILGVLFLLIVPFVVSILVKHQQRMAEIVRGQHAAQQDSALAQEVRELRQMLAQQSIALDSLAQNQKALVRKLEDDSIHARLNS
jgi:hypothetical protein